MMGYGDQKRNIKKFRSDVNMEMQLCIMKSPMVAHNLCV